MSDATECAVHAGRRPETITAAAIREALLGPSDSEGGLFRDADRVRREKVGDEVHLRGLIEFANYCRCACVYCGLRAGNAEVRRYRMSREEILGAARLAKRLGYGTVVLQSGEDGGLELPLVTGVVRSIKQKLGLAVTLSMGELTEREYAALREAGADRYLLKHETSNPVLFRKLRPGLEIENRLACVRTLRALGFQVGGGCMVGLPGQTVDDMVGDLLLLRELDIDMAGIGPFIPCPGTPLWGDAGTWPRDARIRATYRMMALLRLVCPEAMIPVTTALATLDPEARRLGLQRGANVIMPNVGDIARRRDYVIYPGKAGLGKTADVAHEELMALLRSLSRRPGEGPGHRRRGEGG